MTFASRSVRNKNHRALGFLFLKVLPVRMNGRLTSGDAVPMRTSTAPHFTTSLLDDQYKHKTQPSNEKVHNEEGSDVKRIF